MGLDAILDIFGCCLFNWGLVTTVLPAFLLAGALTTFLPTAVLVRYVGRDARPWVAYTAGATSGFVLPTCSCNIVPLFISIRQGGAGLGPAVAFLFAGPAINLVSMVWVFQVLGWRLGLFRAVGVPLLSVTLGLAMALLFRRREAARPRPAGAAARVRGLRRPWRAAGTLGALVLALLLGASPLPTALRVALSVALLAGLATVHLVWLDRDDFYDWMTETYKLLKLVVPLLLLAVLLIAVVAKVVPVGALTALMGDNGPLSTVTASVFGALMYFPILSEVVLAKTLLVQGVAAGPVFSILLSGAGLSLPGILLVRTVLGGRETVAYLVLLVALATGGGLLFGGLFGDLDHTTLVAVLGARELDRGAALDTDGDGSIDVITLPIDADGDGHPEEIRTWRYLAGRLLESALDRGADGHDDERYLYEYDAAGQLLRQTHDSDGDGRPDRAWTPATGWQPTDQ